MASIYGFSMSKDYSHMYKKKDLVSTKRPEVIPNNSILGIINNDDFCKFNYVLHLSGFDKYLTNDQSNFTLFAVPDSLFQEDIYMMEKWDALKLVRNHLYEGTVYYKDLITEGGQDIKMKSGELIYATYENDKLLFDNYSPYTDQKTFFIEEYPVQNGNVIIINNLLYMLDRCA